MSFSERLDFLMILTNTSNSILARQTSLDPSFISRLRSGSRKPSRNENYISLMSKVLARRCQDDYQKQGLKNRLKSEKSLLASENFSLEVLIERWLKDNEDADNRQVGIFLSELDGFSFKKVQTVRSDDNGYTKAIPRRKVYQGISGKRMAVLQFLRDTLENPEPRTLYLYSDEDLSWLIDDPRFTQEWAKLFMQVLKKGNKVRIVHTISRSLDEMFAAIKEWLPFYLTGNIEPYYYPRTRDATFSRTLFISPGLCALSSNSMGKNTERHLNFLLTDTDTIDALLSEFEDFLKLCRPLMKIFNSTSRMSLIETINEFEAEKADSKLLSPTLSSITLPLFALEKVIKHHSQEEKRVLLSFHKKRHQDFANLLDSNSFTEIILLPGLTEVLESRIPIGFTVFTDTPVYYDAFSLRAQLENILSLMKHYPQYKVILADSIKDELTIYAKENVGLIIMKYNSPKISFAINEPYMTQAFWDYLGITTSSQESEPASRKDTIQRITGYIEKLKDR